MKRKQKNQAEVLGKHYTRSESRQGYIEYQNGILLHLHYSIMRLRRRKYALAVSQTQACSSVIIHSSALKDSTLLFFRAAFLDPTLLQIVLRHGERRMAHVYHVVTVDSHGLS